MAKVDADFEDLRALFNTKAQVHEDMGETAKQTAAKVEKKRKVEPQRASGASQSASTWADAASRASSAGASSRDSFGPSGLGGGGSSAGGGPPNQPRSDLRTQVAVKRLPQVMRTRLQVLMLELFALSGSGLVRVQGPPSGTAFTLVLDSEMAAAAVLRRHRSKPFEGAGAPAVPLVLQPDRKRWMQTLLTM